MDKEYEYTIIVDSLEPYFRYCRENGFTLTEKCEQTRTIYRNPNKTMARITINKTLDGHEKKQLDFKEDNLVEGQVLKEVKESQSIDFTDDKAVESILEFLDYKKDNSMTRVRTVYEIEGAKFEIDEYITPKQANVVSVEGNDQKKVDKIFNEITKLDNQK